MLGAHVQTVGKVLHEVSGHHITTSASIAGVHWGGWNELTKCRGVLTYKSSRRNNQSALVEILYTRVRRLAHQIHKSIKDMIMFFQIISALIYAQH